MFFYLTKFQKLYEIYMSSHNNNRSIIMKSLNSFLSEKYNINLNFRKTHQILIIVKII